MLILTASGDYTPVLMAEGVISSYRFIQGRNILAFVILRPLSYHCIFCWEIERKDYLFGNEMCGRMSFLVLDAVIIKECTIISLANASSARTFMVFGVYVQHSVLRVFRCAHEFHAGGKTALGAKISDRFCLFLK